MAEPARKLNQTRVVTGKCRASYVYIKEPNDRGKYSITLLIPKSDKETLGKIKAAQQAASLNTWPNKDPSKTKTTLHDGDEPRPSDGEDYGPECKGHMVISVTSKSRPGIVDKQGETLFDLDDFQSGDYCRASITFKTFDVDGNKGVTGYLNNLQYLHKGEPLNGRNRAEDEFGEWDDGADNDSAW